MVQMLMTPFFHSFFTSLSDHLDNTVIAGLQPSIGLWNGQAAHTVLGIGTPQILSNNT